MATDKTETIRLPKSWKPSVRSAILHVVSLAQYAAVHTRSWAADGTNQRVRLKAENDRVQQELVLLREEFRIKDSRMGQISAYRRPHYAPVERMAILELKAARGWSKQQAASAFLVTAATIASWMNRVDEERTDALVQLREPVNKFPEFVRYVVLRLKTLCPTMGKKKSSDTLARAGYWCSWIPFALPQCWPFCWWVAIAMDHFSRRVAGITLFRQEMVLIGAWYNEHRPHMTLGGKTPNEVDEKRFPANRKPRIEPRPRWPTGSPCAKPQALVAGKPGQRFEMNVAFHGKRRHLPIVTLQRAA